MSANDINSVIDNLCNKLNTTSECLIPEYAKMHITSAWFWIVICAIVILISIICIIYIAKSDELLDGENTAALFLIVIIACIYICGYNIKEIVQWNIAPLGKFTEYILGKF